MHTHSDYMIQETYESPDRDLSYIEVKAELKDTQPSFDGNDLNASAVVVFSKILKNASSLTFCHLIHFL